MGGLPPVAGAANFAEILIHEIVIPHDRIHGHNCS
jgi:hypothetical protein